MSDSSSWTLPLGRWRRVQFRVHALFLVVALFAVLLATSQDEPAAVYGALAVAILFASVLAHELGHVFAAGKVHGSTDSVVLGPLGGMGPLDAPREPHAELITILAGPTVTMGLLLGVLPVLFVAGSDISGLLSPLHPVGLTEGAWWLVALKLTFWINWVLVIANLLPAFPLDGAGCARCCGPHRLPRRVHGGRSRFEVNCPGIVHLGVAGARCASAAVLPSWLPLVMLAIFVYFSASHEVARGEETDWKEEMFSYDFSQGYTSLERGLEPRPRPVGPVQRWLTAGASCGGDAENCLSARKSGRSTRSWPA